MRVPARLLAASALLVTGLVPPAGPVSAAAAQAIPGNAPAAYRITDLGPLPGGTSAVATAINNAGVVAGYSTFSTDAGWLPRAVTWKNGVVTDLGFLPGGSSSQANAINDAGQVAGPATRPAG